MKITALIVATWIALPCAAGADILITRDGQRIGTDGAWKDRGRRIVYTPKGVLSSIRTDEIDLEMSREATDEAIRPKPKPAWATLSPRGW